MKFLVSCIFILFFAQLSGQDSSATYKKRVLETAEIDFLSSYYSQEGDNAAVTGGRGTEALTDLTPTIVVAVPLNNDDILTLDIGISAYTSASSSNVDPFDGPNPADPFMATSGASANDVWTNGIISYSHSSDDRNKIWGGKLSLANEYDYFSVGFGGNYSYLFNEKNTEIGANANIYLDKWTIIYPSEFRPIELTSIEALPTDKRNSYSLGLSFSQILSKRSQFSLSLDLVQQEGLLSTPFQRIYFADRDDIFVQDFQLGDDIERLPDDRFKTAIGARFNYYINEIFVLRTYYRYYLDNWGINSHTATLELPIKLGTQFTFYPSYRYYSQTASDYFYPYNTAISTSQFYTSDYDLSKFNANQFSFGITYTDIFAKLNILGFGLKQISAKGSFYDRDTTFHYYLISGGLKFVND